MTSALLLHTVQYTLRCDQSFCVNQVTSLNTLHSFLCPSAQPTAWHSYNRQYLSPRPHPFHSPSHNRTPPCTFRISAGASRYSRTPHTSPSPQIQYRSQPGAHSVNTVQSLTVSTCPVANLTQPTHLEMLHGLNPEPQMPIQKLILLCIQYRHRRSDPRLRADRCSGITGVEGDLEYLATRVANI